MNGEQSFYAALSGNKELPPAPSGGAPMSSVLEPQQDIVKRISVPAANPDEITQRKGVWEQVVNAFQTNPNLQFAMAMMGAQMAQPTPAGQTKMGQFAQSALTGATAFKAGEYQTYQQKRQAQADELEKTRVGASVEASRASTELSKAQLPAAQAASQVAQGTAEAKIAEAKAASESAALRLKTAKRTEEIAEIEGELKKARLEAQKGIPDAKLREAALAEVDAQILAVREAKARIKASEATSAAKGAEAGVAQVTLEQLKAMPDEEKRQFLTKSGKYANTSSSAILQQAGMWGSIYDKLPATDPSKKGKTKEQFQMTMLNSTKAKDVTDMMKNYVLAGGDDAEILASFSDILKSSLAARQGTGVDPKVAPTAEKWVRDKDGKLVRVKQDVKGQIK